MAKGKGKDKGKGKVEGKSVDRSWIEAELEDSFDEELEMEIDDERIARELRQITDLKHKLGTSTGAPISTSCSACRRS